MDDVPYALGVLQENLAVPANEQKSIAGHPCNDITISKVVQIKAVMFNMQPHMSKSGPLHENKLQLNSIPGQ